MGAPVAESTVGRSDPLIRAAGNSDRLGSATDRQKRRQQPEHHKDRDEPKDRRAQDAVNQRRRALFDLLFEEIEQAPDMGARQRARLRENLRAHLTGRAPPHPEDEPPATPEEIRRILDSSDDPDDHPDLDVDPDRIVAVAAPQHETLPPEDVSENAILAKQFRRCLEIHTTTARRVALYLKLLLRLGGALKPHIVVDV